MSKLLTKIYRFILATPKTIYFNLHYFNFTTACQFPVIVSHKVKLRKLKGSIELGKVKFAMVRIGFGDMECYDFNKTPTLFSNAGKIIFKGKLKIGSGAVISNQGKIIFGENTNITKTALICREQITIGNDCLFDWDCLIMDTDHHHIYSDEALQHKINLNRPIKIHDHVWLGAKVTVLKGVTIASNNVVASGTTITKNINYEHAIIANEIQTKILKENIYWHE